jgi:hypothetical protein
MREIPDFSVHLLQHLRATQKEFDIALPHVDELISRSFREAQAMGYEGDESLWQLQVRWAR